MEKNITPIAIVAIICTTIITVVCICVCCIIAVFAIDEDSTITYDDDFNSPEIESDDQRNVTENLDLIDPKVPDITPFAYEESSTPIDDDPVLGDIDSAKVVIVEFGDYKCPFCQRYFKDTHKEIVDKYVKTGDVAIVYRDFPLEFHNPMATNAALAAECVQHLDGDNSYFEFHNLIFENDGFGGNVLNENDLYDFAEITGVNLKDFSSCYENQMFIDEIEHDISDAMDAGVSGTPSFVIGFINDDGIVSGVRIDGAYSFGEFKLVIDNFIEQYNSK